MDFYFDNPSERWLGKMWARDHLECMGDRLEQTKARTYHLWIYVPI